MENYFYDFKGNIKTELLDDKAKEIARVISNISSSQLRKFYNEVKSYEKRLKENNSDEYFYKLLPLIKMLKAKVFYAHGASISKDKVPEEFVKFITESIDRIKSKEDFFAFVLHFESVVGFYYAFSK